MSYKIAFIGYNETQTRLYFDDFVKQNIEQVQVLDLKNGILTLKDGTIITTVKPVPEFYRGRKFDQVIVADDHRGLVTQRRFPELWELERCMESSVVPHLFRWILYDLDAEEASV